MTEKEYYEKIKAEYEASTDYKLVEWARPYFEGTKKPVDKDVFKVCAVSDRAADEIMRLTGSDVHGFTHAIASSEVVHIRKRHGLFGNGDHSMQNISDLGRMGYVLNKFDTIELTQKRSRKFRNKKGEKALIIIFTKRIDGHVYTAEAVTDAENKRLMCVHSMYKKSSNKKWSREPDAHKCVPGLNVRNEVDSVTSILPQPDKNVNSAGENNSSVSATAPRTPTFAEIAAKYKDYRPPRKPPTSGSGNGKGSSDSGGRGR